MTKRYLPAVLAAAFAGSVSAAGFQLWEQNASGIGTAYAGSAAIADNASTIFYNPAGMVLLPGAHISLGMTGVRPSFKFSDEGSAGTGLVGTMMTGGNGGDAGGWGMLPNAYLSWQVAPQWFVGLGFSSPFGLSTEYEDSNWIGRFQSLKAKITTANVNPSVAYKLNDQVALGFGLDYQHIDAEMTSLVPTGPGTTALYRLKGDTNTWGWNAGALFTPSSAMRVGISYRSPIKHELEGDRSIGPLTGSAEASLKLPATAILSVWQQLSNRWEAMGDLSYTHWSTVDTLNVIRAGGIDVEPFNYRNAWRVAYGAAYKANDAWKLKFGLAYDRSPVADGDRSARLPDNHRVWLSLGAQWKPSKESAVDLGYAYIYVNDASITQTKDFRGLSPALGTATLRGRYDESGHVLGVQYSHGF